jgi:hypothetical protein
MSVEYALMLVLVTGVLVTGLGVGVRQWFSSFLCPFESQLGLGSSCAADGPAPLEPSSEVQPTGGPSNPSTAPTTGPTNVPTTCDSTSTSDAATTSSQGTDPASDCSTSSSSSSGTATTR